MEDISGLGISVTIFASKTFPAGLTVSQFADDADPLDLPDIEILSEGMNVNGELVTWLTPKPLIVDLNLLPETEDSKNLDILFDANRPAYKKVTVRDVITLVVNYPDGKKKVLNNGRPKAYAVSPSIASAGRYKSRRYQFVFENKIN